MALRILPPLSRIFRDALERARGRLLTLTALALFPLVPLVLFAPFVAQVSVGLVEGGATDSVTLAAYVEPWTGALAGLGLLGSLVVSIAGFGGMLDLLASPIDPGPREAFRHGARRFLAIVWTQLLATIAAGLAGLPAVLFTAWAWFSYHGGLAGSGDLPRFVQVVAILLALPAFVVLTWYAFAVIPAARGEAQGVGALLMSRRLVEGATAQTFGLLFAWVLFELLLALLLPLFFPTLPLFTAFTTYLLTAILGPAYLVALYEVLRRT